MPMREEDCLHIIGELDALLADIQNLLNQFEASGCTVTLKEDYIALHALQGRTLMERQRHIDEAPGTVPTLSAPLNGIAWKDTN